VNTQHGPKGYGSSLLPSSSTWQRGGGNSTRHREDTDTQPQQHRTQRAYRFPRQRRVHEGKILAAAPARQGSDRTGLMRLLTPQQKRFRISVDHTGKVCINPLPFCHACGGGGGAGRGGRNDRECHEEETQTARHAKQTSKRLRSPVLIPCQDGGGRRPPGGRVSSRPGRAN
jgi:hypothetical protein